MKLIKSMTLKKAMCGHWGLFCTRCFMVKSLMMASLLTKWSRKFTKKNSTSQATYSSHQTKVSKSMYLKRSKKSSKRCSHQIRMKELVLWNFIQRSIRFCRKNKKESLEVVLNQCNKPAKKLLKMRLLETKRRDF